MADPLDLFLPPVREWFRATLGTPTAAQRDGWPAIAGNQNTLILAPTGSGKTLAAFLACLDRLWRQDPLPPGVQVLYISPLKALNNDIHRNLQVPLEGVAATARALGQPLPTIETGVRTGDTPQAERQRLIRRPPPVLITTPESLHLLLTSRARDTLRTVTHVIIDEIHALCPNKRGVFLALLLERLAVLVPRGFVRIGLSATQRPLDEVARYLGGQNADLTPRPVTIVDAGLRRDLDLRVVSPVEHFGMLPDRSIWPPIYRLVRQEIERHRSTIVFANNRRSVERITSNLNALAEEANAGREPSEEDQAADGSPTPPAGPLARAHHGSVALEVRQATEQALKDGRLAAVVATASLELGIDMGAVDLVCQVESPGSVARGLQRVGRAGHVVGQKSKGRLIPKTPMDLLEQAVLAHAMAAGNVEPVHCPRNCLDVLAQQIVAMTATEPWDVPALYTCIRQAYPYRDLAPAVFESVLEMVSGRFTGSRTRVKAPEQASPRAAGKPRPGTLTALQPRISWDRVHNRLHALPGSQQLALVNGGAIPDTGQYAAYTTSGVRIGELDEEFVYERRIGDVFLLGTNAWRLDRIDADRVTVIPAEGAPALVPFWRGEQAGRTYDLGRALGEFLREAGKRLDDADFLDWLQRDYFLDPWAARNLRAHLRRQQAVTEVLPSDRTLLVEASRDPLGDWQVLVLSPFGGRLHLGLRLALENRLRERLGYRPQIMHHNDGLLIRLADTDEPILDVFDGLTADNVERLIVDALADSALFALRFRQNAARALLLPRGQPGKRAPLWLQRLRGHDLLQVARRHPDFPIVAETLRECLHDHLDLDHLQQLLAAIQAKQIAIVARRADTPSPFAAGLLFDFMAANMYSGDQAEPDNRPPALDKHLLQQLVAPASAEHLLDPRAIHQVERRLRGLGMPPRSQAEMAEWLRQLGDLTADELEGPMAAFLQQLAADGRAKQIALPGGPQPERWILSEDEEQYCQAFGIAGAAIDADAAETILFRFLATHALVGLADVLRRYPFESRWAQRKLDDWAQTGRVVTVPARRESLSADGEVLPAADTRYSLPANLEGVQRGSLALLRREVLTCPAPQFADFVLRWQHVHPDARRGAAAGLGEVLGRLEGVTLPAGLWERVILPARVPGCQPRWLDEAIASGEWSWVGSGDDDLAVAFWQREHLPEVAPPTGDLLLAAAAQRVLDHLQQRGASFVVDIAQATGLTPSAVRAGLWQLVRTRLVSNDAFQVARKGEETEPPPAASARAIVRKTLRAPRAPTEGRWSLLPWGRPEAEAQAVFQASLLLNRYGVVARELAQMEPALPSWRVLYEVLTRLELAGDVRRGYFVEGLSGAQFALPDAARLLQECALPSTASAPVVLLHSLDPANLYGSGAPLDIALLDGGTRPLLRRPGNWLLIKAGRPVLIVEQQGKKLTALPSASQADIAAAVARLPEILTTDNGLAVKHKLTVAEWNGQPVTGSAGRELLESAGFVRDYQEMTLYAAWR